MGREGCRLISKSLELYLGSNEILGAKLLQQFIQEAFFVSDAVGKTSVEFEKCKKNAKFLLVRSRKRHF